MRALRFATRLWTALGCAPAGLPAATPDQERVGRIIGALAVAWILLVGLWGIAGTFPEGHYASAAAIGTAAANIWRLHTIFPVPYNLDHPVTPANYYMHHPVGLFWMTALLFKLLGEANWVLRLAPALITAATAHFLYRTARALWGPIEAGLAAMAFVAVPITMGFAAYLDLEGPVTFGCLVGTWGYVRMVQTWRPRYAAAGVVGLVFALGYDWETGFWLAGMLAISFVWAYVLSNRARRRIDFRVFGRYYALMLLSTFLVLAVAFALLQASGRFDDLFNAYTVRSSGRATPLALVLQARRVRIELMFTPIAIALGKLAVAVILARFVITRDHLELMPLPLLLMATAYYVVFKNGADTHIFWPRPFTGYLGLATGALAASVRQGGGSVMRLPALARASYARAAAALPWLSLILIGIPLLLVFADGVRLLRLARESGGRFMEANLESYVDEAEVLRWFLARYPPAEKMGFHTPLFVPWSVQWEIRPRAVQTRQPLNLMPPAGSRLFMIDTRSATPAELKEAATRWHVQAVQQFWLIDRSRPPAPLDGFSAVEREPGLGTWMLRGGVEPTRTVEPNPFVTWEMRTAVGQAAPPPGRAPQTLDEVRIAHNVAIAAGRSADAAALRARLLNAVNLPVHANYDNGTKLLGVVHHRGAARSLTLLFEAGKFATQAKYAVNATVVGRSFLSTLPVDPAVLDTANPPILPTPIWTPGHIYALKVVYHQRAGHEKLTGTFLNGPRRTDGAEPLPLLTL